MPRRSATRSPTVTVRMGDEDWQVPRGFGAAYRRVWGDMAEPDVLSDMLILLDIHVAAERIEAMTERARIDAEVWAAQTILWVNDNPVPRPPMPAWMPAEGHAR